MPARIIIKNTILVFFNSKKIINGNDRNNLNTDKILGIFLIDIFIFNKLNFLLLHEL